MNILTCFKDRTSNEKLSYKIVITIQSHCAVKNMLHQPIQVRENEDK